jgi:hypothetical protein
MLADTSLAASVVSTIAVGQRIRTVPARTQLQKALVQALSLAERPNRAEEQHKRNRQRRKLEPQGKPFFHTSSPSD